MMIDQFIDVSLFIQFLFAAAGRPGRHHFLLCNSHCWSSEPPKQPPTCPHCSPEGSSNMPDVQARNPANSDTLEKSQNVAG